MKKIAVIIILISVISVKVSFSAKDSDDENQTVFKPVYINGSKRLFLRGTATYRYLKLIRAYSGALYMKKEDDSKKILDKIPKRLVLEYFQGIESEDFFRATIEMMGKNINKSELTLLKNQLETLRKTYRDVKPGDRYSITYFPDTGTELALNGKELNLFKGELFARAMFSIWLGETPIDKAFRDKLLKNP
ncbi:MAG: chalcone isomerase family protein [Thermodesulfobacteriota bacterium]